MSAIFEHIVPETYEGQVGADTGQTAADKINGNFDEVANELDNKVTSVNTVTTYNQAYIKNANGNDGLLNISQQPLEYTIPERLLSGNIRVGSVPIHAQDTTSKQYVDTKLGDLEELIVPEIWYGTATSTSFDVDKIVNIPNFVSSNSFILMLRLTAANYATNPKVTINPGPNQISGMIYNNGSALAKSEFLVAGIYPLYWNGTYFHYIDYALRSLVEDKVTKVTTQVPGQDQRVYSINYLGGQGTIYARGAAESGSLAMRGTGGALRVGLPTDSDHAVPLEYFNSFLNPGVRDIVEVYVNNISPNGLTYLRSSNVVTGSSYMRSLREWGNIFYHDTIAPVSFAVPAVPGYLDMWPGEFLLEFELHVRMGSTVYPVTWWAGILWPNGAPTFSAYKTTVVVFRMMQSKHSSVYEFHGDWAYEYNN